jgi:type II secretion system protein G
LKRQGFTLIELLAVVVMVGILIGLVGAAYQAARNRARRQQCASEVRELAKAIQMYFVTYGELPPFVGSEMNAANVAILQTANPDRIKFMDFPTDAATRGFNDPWGHPYRVELRLPQVDDTWRYKTRVYLVHGKAALYDF